MLSATQDGGWHLKVRYHGKGWDIYHCGCRHRQCYVRTRLSLVNPSHASGSTEAEESESRESDVVLVNDAERPSVLEEEGGDQVGGSAAGEGEQGVLLEGITSDIPRPKLVQATEVDPT